MALNSCRLQCYLDTPSPKKQNEHVWTSWLICLENYCEKDDERERSEIVINGVYFWAKHKLHNTLD